MTYTAFPRNVLIFTLIFVAQGISSNLLAQDNPDQLEQAPAPSVSAASSTDPIPESPALTSKPERAPVENVEKTKFNLYQDGLKAHEIVPIETSSTAFIGLWEPAKGPNEHGAVIMLPDSGHTPDWPSTIGPLRTSLSDFGWATLAIAMPHKKNVPPPKRPKPKVKPPIENKDADLTADEDVTPANTAPTSEPVTIGEALDLPVTEASMSYDPEEDSANRISDSMSYAYSRGKLNVVLIAEGDSAIRMARYLTNKPVFSDSSYPSSIRALVLINPTNNTLERNESLTQMLGEMPIPILDIYFKSDGKQKSSAQIRQQDMRRKKQNQYQQVGIHDLNTLSFDNESTLTRRIRGFIQKTAKGKEISRGN